MHLQDTQEVKVVRCLPGARQKMVHENRKYQLKVSFLMISLNIMCCNNIILKQ